VIRENLFRISNTDLALRASGLKIERLVASIEVFFIEHYICDRGHRGRDRMVVGFTTTYAISAYQH